MLISKLKIVKFLLHDSFHKYLLLFPLGFLSSFFDLISIGLLLPLISFIVKPDGEYENIPDDFNRIMELFKSNFSLEGICILMLVVIVLKNIFVFLIANESYKITNKIRGQWMNNLFVMYTYSNYKLFVERKHGDLLNNLFTLTSDGLKGLKELVNMFMFSITVLFSLIVLFLISWKVTLVILLITSLFYFFLQKPLTKGAVTLGSLRIKYYQNVQSIPNDAFKGMREIKTYSAEQNVINEYYNAVLEMVKLRIKLFLYQILPSVFPEIILITLFCITIIYLNRFSVSPLSNYFPFLITYLYASQRLFVNAGNLVKSFLVFSANKPAINYLNHEMSSYYYDDVTQGNRLLKGTEVNLNIENLSFSYDDNAEVIKGLSIGFKKGEFIAIVGGSGAGKSTLADLILRLYDPSSGSIHFDGINICEYDLLDWRKRIGFVSQDTFLFNGTIRDNICLGQSGEISDIKIIEASKKANAHDFIMNTEKGYDTIVGERGAKFSGGQRQRISLSRALVRKPEILILDEATSALDSYNEQLVMKGIRSRMQDIILIVIAHRLSTIVEANKIFVMKDGEIVEEGEHDELIKANGEYSNLYFNGNL